MFDIIHHGHDPDFWVLLFSGSGAGRDGRQEYFWIILTDIQRTELDTGVTGCLDQWWSPRIG